MLRTDGFIIEDFRFREGKAASYRLPLQASRVRSRAGEEEWGQGRRVERGLSRSRRAPGGLGSGWAIWGHLVFLGRHALEFGWRQKQFQSLGESGWGGRFAQPFLELKKEGVGS